jgi:signal peptidase I
MKEKAADSGTDRVATSYRTTMPVDAELRSRLAQVREEEAKRRSVAEMVKRERRVLVPILVLCLLALPNFRTAKVDGRSMQPTFHTGDTLLLLRTYRYFSPVKIGDIVVVHLMHGRIAGDEIVKRVIFVQNAEGNASWPKILAAGRGDVSAQEWFPGYVGGVETVPPGYIMVMGDNTLNSMDSRDFGPVSPDEIEGKVIYG